METGSNQTILASKRLTFRPHILADMETYCAMEMDPEVRRYVGGKPRLPGEAGARFKGALEPREGLLQMWATVLAATGKYIGRCGIYPHFDADGKPIPGEASLGLYIAREYWGKGYATEAGRAFINLGFNQLQLDRIVALVQVENDASIRVLQKLGLVITGTEHNGTRSFYNFALKNQLK